MERQSPTSGYLGWNLLVMESVACDQYLFHTHQNHCVTAHAVTHRLYTTRGLAGTTILHCVLQSDDEIFYPSVTASTVYFAVICRRSSTTAGDTNRLYKLESRRLVLWLQNHEDWFCDCNWWELKTCYAITLYNTIYLKKKHLTDVNNNNKY